MGCFIFAITGILLVGMFIESFSGRGEVVMPKCKGGRKK